MVSDLLHYIVLCADAVQHLSDAGSHGEIEEAEAGFVVVLGLDDHNFHLKVFIHGCKDRANDRIRTCDVLADSPIPRERNRPLIDVGVVNKEPGVGFEPTRGILTYKIRAFDRSAIPA